MSPDTETPPETPTPPGSGPAGRRFDFRHPVFLSSSEWRKIRMETAEYAESLAALLSTYLRLECGVQLAKIETAPFNDFTATLPNPTHITLFKLEPLRGISVIDVRPAIGLAMIDRLLGGPGKPAAPDRNLTDMEAALMDQVVQLALGEWCKQWRRFQELRAEILGHENNPRFLQSASGETVMLIVTLEARMGESSGQIQLALPYSAFEPILTELTGTAEPPPGPPPAQALKWNRNLDAVPLSLKARWPAFKMSARELLNLKPGEFLPLPPGGAEQIELRAGAAAKFTGRLGTRDEKWAVQISEISKV